MNYLEQVVAFNRWKEVNPLPASAIALWYELMAICNKAGWPQEFTVPNGLLQAGAGISRKQLDHARGLLISMNLIEYKKSNKVNQAGKYRIIPIVQKGQREEHTRDNDRHTTGTREEHTRDTLFKHKLNEKNNTSSDASDSERKLLSVLANVKKYPFDYEKDLEFIRQLSVDFPELNLQEQLKKWATYKLDKPLTTKSNPRSQIRTWCKKAVEWGQGKKKQKASSGYWHEW